MGETTDRVFVPAPTTASELPSHGELVAAPVIPAKGDTGVEVGSPAVVVVKAFWESPTVKVARWIVLAGLGKMAWDIGSAVLLHGGVFGLAWTDVLKSAVNGGVLAAVGAFMAWYRTRDNNPVDISKKSGASSSVLNLKDPGA